MVTGSISRAHPDLPGAPPTGPADTEPEEESKAEVTPR